MLRQTVIIHEYERGLLYRWGRFAGELPAGRYRLWSWSGCEIGVVDLRETSLQVAGQEVLSADGAGVRLNLLVRYRVAEAAKARHTVSSYTDALHQTVQLAVRSLVVQRDFEVLLKERAQLSAELTATVREQALAYGLEVTLVALKDLALDPVLQMAYQAKLTADQQGQAKLIEARHAVAVARAQANAANLLAENPGLVLQKQLEVLGKAAERGMGNFIVVPESLAEVARKLARQ